MLLAVQNCLIQMGDTPTLGDVELEQLRQFFSGRTGDGVAPSAEGSNLVAVLIQHQVAVHHAGNADGGNAAQLLAKFCFYLVPKLAIAGANTLHSGFQRVDPNAIFQTILPRIGAGCQNLMVFVDQNGFDTGRAQLNADNGRFQIHIDLLKKNYEPMGTPAHNDSVGFRSS